MNRLTHLSHCLALVIMAVVIAGCAGGMSIVPIGAKAQNADRKFEQAETMQIRSDTKENKQKDLAKQKELYDKALAGYLGIIEQDATGKYGLWSHLQAAAVYRKRFDWDEATQHYQEIVDLSPTGYFGGRAKSGIADIRKNRQILAEKRATYQNRKALYDQLIQDERTQVQAQSSYEIAAQALYDVAKAYQTLGNYPEAILQYERLVAEFPDHKLSPQAQFQIGNIYFYERYDYIGGWPAFNKVIEKFPDSYEASEADTLLKRTAEILTDIAQDQADIQKYTNKKAIQYEKAGRFILASDRYLSGYTDRIVQDFQSIAGGWIRLKNYPFAIASYRKLATNLSYKKFAAADALFRIGELYQKDGEYQQAIAAFDDMLALAPESTWRAETVYQQAVCYRAIREFEKAYEGFKGYMSLKKDDRKYYREAEQIVRQYELDQDQDGHMFYKEQEAGTSDQDPNDYPGAAKPQASR
ncbi:MAG: tetratricopeptide repeat protein [Candidatus Poribacteria bacterium]|nr:tetratricopeptide repeat protein [Candidatus Poribacteria bacterium]